MNQHACQCKQSPALSAITVFCSYCMQDAALVGGCASLSCPLYAYRTGQPAAQAVATDADRHADVRPASRGAAYRKGGL